MNESRFAGELNYIGWNHWNGRVEGSVWVIGYIASSPIEEIPTERQKTNITRSAGKDAHWPRVRSRGSRFEFQLG